MTGIDIDQATFFDGPATLGRWGPVLSLCEPPLMTEPLRVRIHRHLKRFPLLTAWEIARALHLPNPAGAGATRVRNELRRMELDGEAARRAVPRNEGDRRMTVRWEAT